MCDPKLTTTILYICFGWWTLANLDFLVDLYLGDFHAAPLSIIGSTLPLLPMLYRTKVRGITNSSIALCFAIVVFFFFAATFLYYWRVDYFVGFRYDVSLCADIEELAPLLVSTLIYVFFDLIAVFCYRDPQDAKEFLV